LSGEPQSELQLQIAKGAIVSRRPSDVRTRSPRRSRASRSSKGNSLTGPVFAEARVVGLLGWLRSTGNWGREIDGRGGTLEETLRDEAADLYGDAQKRLNQFNSSKHRSMSGRLRQENPIPCSETW
jgi:hypothetical protein